MLRRSPLAAKGRAAASFSCLACLAASLAAAAISFLFCVLFFSPATRAIRLSSGSTPSSAGCSLGPASAAPPAVATAAAAVGASFGCIPVLGPGSSAALGCSALAAAASLDCLASLAASLAATANLFFFVLAIAFQCCISPVADDAQNQRWQWSWPETSVCLSHCLSIPRACGHMNRQASFRAKEVTTHSQHFGSLCLACLRNLGAAREPA